MSRRALLKSLEVFSDLRQCFEKQFFFARVGPVAEGAARQEVSLDITEAALHARRDQRGGLNRPQLAADLGAVRRAVVLHLLAGLEVMFSDGFVRFVADALPPAKGRQRLIRERSA